MGSHQTTQDQDGSRTGDQGRGARGVFTGEERPGGPYCRVAQDNPVRGGGDAVQALGAQHPYGLRDSEQAGEHSSAPAQQLHQRRSPPPVDGEVTTAAFPEDSQLLPRKRMVGRRHPMERGIFASLYAHFGAGVRATSGMLPTQKRDIRLGSGLRRVVGPRLRTVRPPQPAEPVRRPRRLRHDQDVRVLQ
jgi:hypothetical protein